MLEPELREHVRAKDNEQEVQLRVDGAPRKFLAVFFLFLFEDTSPDSFNHFPARCNVDAGSVCFHCHRQVCIQRNWFIRRVPCERKRQRWRMFLTTSIPSAYLATVRASFIVSSGTKCSLRTPFYSMHGRVTATTTSSLICYVDWRKFYMHGTLPVS